MSRTQKLKGLSAASLRLKTLNDNPYTKVCDFNYAGVSAYRNIHAADIEPEAKYVKFVVTATGRTGGALKVPLCHLAEFNICYR